MSDDDVRQVCMDLFPTVLGEKKVEKELANSVKACVTDHVASATGKMLALVDQFHTGFAGQPAALDQQILGVIRRDEQIDVCTGALQDHGGRLSSEEGD
eukprot:6555277-Pyramimonas_sp.AAC.1